jgi:hypothetical protein
MAVNIENLRCLSCAATSLAATSPRTGAFGACCGTRKNAAAAGAPPRQRCAGVAVQQRARRRLALVQLRVAVAGERAA